MTSTTLETETLSPLGARVRGVSLGDPSTDLTALAAGLRPLLAEHGVVVLPDQRLDDARFAEFLRAFGELAFTAGETPVEGHPDLNLISNVGRTRPPRSNFHVDTSYVARPPAYTALRAVQVPDQGGATQFSDQYAAWETLPDDLRRQVEGRTMTHVVTGVELDDGAETSAEHPLVRPHPVTGRPALFLTSAARCASISGLDETGTADLVARLVAHSTRPENLYAHPWAPGDVVIWDNGCVMHRADHAGVVGDRVMHRGMVAAY